MRELRATGLVLAICATCALTSADAAPDGYVALNIHSQPLEDALNEFARQASVQVLFKSLMVEDKTAPQVVGSLTTKEGLEKLLDRSGLRFEFINERTIAIRGIEVASGAGLNDFWNRFLFAQSDSS